MLNVKKTTKELDTVADLSKHDYCLIYFKPPLKKIMTYLSISTFYKQLSGKLHKISIDYFFLRKSKIITLFLFLGKLCILSKISNKLLQRY